MKKIVFATRNPEKVKEAKRVLREFGIGVEQARIELPEPKEMGQKEIVLEKANAAARELGRTCVVEDTALYFEAFPLFPGVQPKFVAKTLAWSGIKKLLHGTGAGAKFVALLAFAEPGKKPVLFEGDCAGRILLGKEIADEKFRKEDFPYDFVFSPEGEKRVFAEMSEAEKDFFSHRAKAFRKLGTWLSKK
jgi:non-canonical purine NTP pyrophosphatase (RdgB/HAM1 family)